MVVVRALLGGFEREGVGRGGDDKVNWTMEGADEMLSSVGESVSSSRGSRMLS